MRIPRTALAAILIAAPLAHAQPVPEPDASGLFFQNSANQTQQATRLETEVSIDVFGIVARVAVKQRFRNQSDSWIEGIYVFPLPDDAAVDELTMVIGTRRIEGEIQEREQAKQTYERARAAGQQASLVEQERPNLFTTSVANIAPGEEIAIEIGYLQTAGYDQDEFSLRLPMTLTPRFIPDAPGSIPDGLRGLQSAPRAPARAPSVADANRITPPMLPSGGSATHSATISISVEAGMPLSEIGSPSHQLTSTWDGRVYELTTGDRPVAMDRDLIVNWRVVPDQTPRVAAFTETLDHDSYVLLMFLPPTTAELPQPTARELIFVIDTSGSMGGTSIGQAKSALRSGLDKLNGADRFNVIEFNSDVQTLYSAPVAATVQSVQEARRFVSALSANGGTNIAAAITAALSQPVNVGYLRQIVFITDGSVGNESELFGMIQRDLADARLFTVGIGTAPNTHFMRKAAQFGRGAYSHIAEADQVEPGMRVLFDKLEHVALKDIELSWPEAFEVYPDRIPDLYRGEPVVVAARAFGPLTNAISLNATGTVGPYSWTQRIDVTPENSAGIASIWARRKIESLLDRKLDGEAETLIREAVIDVALTHGMLSPYTSLVAVDKTPSLTRNAELVREALGNMKPAGSEIGALLGIMPNTATDARWYRLIGASLAALLLGSFLVSRTNARSSR